MDQSRQVRLWSFLAFAAVGSTLLTMLAIGDARGGATCPDPSCGDPCVDNADCNCDSTQEMSGCIESTGAGGVCLENADGMNNSLCVCNPGFNPPNCASGACCFPDGSCNGVGQGTCENADGVYQGDGTSCTGVNCPVQCGFATSPECNGECPPGQVCVAGLAGLAVARTVDGCECIPEPTQTPTGTPTDTPTATPTDTASVTPTDTPGMMGAPCEDTSDCEPGLFCADGVCCNDPCTGELERCDLPGQEGTCTPITSVAPVASRGGLIAIVVLLLTVGVFAVVRRRSQPIRTE
jgi:hypothetical protein